MKYAIVILCFIFSISLKAQVQTLDVLSTWSDESLPGSFLYNNTYNEIWGFVAGGHEYGVIGSTMGTHIFDVTDPENIELREFIPGASQGGHIIHRDYHDHNGYLYAVSDESGSEESTLQIIDISGLPDEISVVYDDTDIIERAHNIFIDTTANKLYAMAAKGGDSAYKAMKIYSLENPIDPVKIGQYGVIGGESFGHVHDGYFDNDIAFMNCGNDGLFIVDFSGDDPVLLDRFKSSDYPEAGYNHSGWPTKDLSYYYFADETWGTAMKVLEVNGFSGMQIAGTFDADNDSEFSIAHNQIVHGDYLYVSYYYDGLQIYDIQDPANPVRAFEFKTSTIPTRDSYEGAWGVYPFLPSGNILVSDMQEGLFVLRGPNVSVNNDNTELKDAFSIFPNPTTGILTIDSDIDVESVELFDIQGVAKEGLLRNSQKQFEINTDFPDGIYILKILTAKGYTHKRIYLQK